MPRCTVAHYSRCHPWHSCARWISVELTIPLLFTAGSCCTGMIVSCHTLSGELRPLYHWYNVPANPDPASWNNPLKHLRAVATPEDYVLFKLDVDNNAVSDPNPSHHSPCHVRPAYY